MLAVFEDVKVRSVFSVSKNVRTPGDLTGDIEQKKNGHKKRLEDPCRATPLAV